MEFTGEISTSLINTYKYTTIIDHDSYFNNPIANHEIIELK